MRTNGFSLTELLVVLLIVAILSAIALYAYVPLLERIRDFFGGGS